MSYTFSIFPILSCLKSDEKWNPINELQKTFLEKYCRYQEYLDVFTEEELSSITSSNCEEVNNFLKEKGFDIQLSPSEGGSFIASILDVLLEWDGESCSIPTYNANVETIYEGIKLDGCLGTIGDESVVKFWSKKQPGLCAYITIANESLDQMDLQEKCTELNGKFEYSGLGTCYFPKAEINQHVDISWFVGMHYGDAPTIIAEALNQNKLSLTEEGAHAQSAAAMRFVTGSLELPRTPVTIDKPFYFWLIKDNCPIPIFCAYVDEQDWIKLS